MRTNLIIQVCLAFISGCLADGEKWLSPEYKHFYEFDLPVPPILTPKGTYTNKKGVPMRYYEIEIKPFQAQVYPELGKANLVGYNGISPGPTFMFDAGTEAVVRFINKSPHNSSIHLHGSYSRAPFDGWAEDTTAPGQYKDYYYPNHQAARTLWYHDHAVHHTAENAYFGQAGFYILHDEREQSFGLPSGYGKYDIPLSLNAKQYQSNGDLFSPASETTSLYGDVIHVNGQPWPKLEVEPRKYRFRLCDMAISRQFQLYIEDEAKAGTRIPFYVIGSDAGLLNKPVQTDNLHIAMAERWEIVIDFAPFAGKKILLRNMRKIFADEDYAATDRVMRFNVGTTVSDTTNNGPLPASFDPLPIPPVAASSTPDHSFQFERKNGEWTVNGVTFSDVNNRILAFPGRGAVETWELKNPGGGWSHPVHIHLIDFQIISRTGGNRGIEPYEKEALKDVVLLGANEVLQVRARYVPWDGVYMFHCHNLIHEDHDMMAAFNVSSLPDWGYPETTKFIDPMEPRWRAKDYDPAAKENQLDYIMSVTCESFAELDAYDKIKDVEDALEDYYKTHTSGAKTSTTLSTSTTTATLATTTAPATTGTKTTTDDKGKSSTTKVDDKSTKTSTTKTKRSTQPTRKPKAREFQA